MSAARDKTYLEYIAFGQRFAYAETALRIFADYPILGVGLGNYAFFFDKELPNRPWQNSPEIIRQITPTERGSQLITPKNLPARLLAETGLVGAILFRWICPGGIGRRALFAVCPIGGQSLLGPGWPAWACCISDGCFFYEFICYAEYVGCIRFDHSCCSPPRKFLTG